MTQLKLLALSYEERIRELQKRGHNVNCPKHGLRRAIIAGFAGREGKEFVIWGCRDPRCGHMEEEELKE